MDRAEEKEDSTKQTQCKVYHSHSYLMFCHCQTKLKRIGREEENTGGGEGEEEEEGEELAVLPMETAGILYTCC